MTLRTLSILAVSAVLFPVVAAGCSSSSGGGSSCPEGAQQSCSCDNGTTGTQTCGGEGFGACACGSSPDSGGVDSSPGGDDSGTPESSAGDETDHCNGCGDGGGLSDSSPLDAAPGTFGAACAANSDCQSMDCWDFPAKGGGFCTVPCTQASDCPPQAQGCNGMGQCKVP